MPACSRHSRQGLLLQSQLYDNHGKLITENESFPVWIDPSEQLPKLQFRRPNCLQLSSRYQVNYTNREPVGLALIHPYG